MDGTACGLDWTLGRSAFLTAFCKRRQIRWLGLYSTADFSVSKETNCAISGQISYFFFNSLQFRPLISSFLFVTLLHFLANRRY